MAAKRRISTIILGIIIGGVVGSALSYVLAMAFPKGPVKNFFFSALKVGFDAVNVNLGFFSFTIGLYLNITVLTIVFIFILMYLLHKI